MQYSKWERFWALTIVLVCCTATAIETDIYVPAFPEMRSFFCCSENMIQLVVSINFIGLCLSSLFYGPIVDAYGRRKPLFWGMLIFFVSSLFSLICTDINTFLFFRFLQGIGSSVSFVSVSGVIFDIYDKERAAYLVGYLNSFVTATMAGAPILGGYLNRAFGWRANFALIAFFAGVCLLATYFLLKETMKKEDMLPLNIKAVIENYKFVLSSKRANSYMMLICLFFSGYMLYISNISLVFREGKGIVGAVSDMYQGSVAGVFALFSILSSRVIKRFGLAVARRVGIFLAVVSGGLLYGTSYFSVEHPLFLTIFMCLYAGGFALSCGVIFSDYVDCFPRLRGMAGAMITASRLIGTAFIVWFVALFYNKTMEPITLSIFLIAICCLWLYRVGYRRNLTTQKPQSKS